MSTTTHQSSSSRYRVLVLGGSGMAGHMVATYLQDRGHEVVSVSRSQVQGLQSISLDVTDFEGLDRLIVEGEFDVVVNCIGMLVAQSQATPSVAALINGYLPHHLADALATTKTRLIHLSTDCVFEGDAAPYTEDHLRDGRSFYDRSKALGEVDNGKDLTLRMSIIGPEIRVSGTGLLHWCLSQSGEVGGYTRAIWNGITTLELAKAIDRLLGGQLSGIYHLVPAYSTSKFDLLADIAGAFGREDITLLANDSVSVDKTLVDTRQELGFVVGPDGYRAMLDELAAWVGTHAALYEHDPRYSA